VPKSWHRERRSILWTDVGLATAIVLMGVLVGFRAFLLIQLPVTLLSTSIGVWLFYVQHQFEHTTWTKGGDWNPHDAALRGSSYYDLPGFLRWFTANIGMHHVHHLCSRIPYYRLPRVMRDRPELRDVSRLTMLQSLRGVRLTLWDETRQRLVSFRAARTPDRG